MNENVYLGSQCSGFKLKSLVVPPTCTATSTIVNGLGLGNLGSSLGSDGAGGMLTSTQFSLPPSMSATPLPASDLVKLTTSVEASCSNANTNIAAILTATQVMMFVEIFSFSACLMGYFYFILHGKLLDLEK